MLGAEKLFKAGQLCCIINLVVKQGPKFRGKPLHPAAKAFGCNFKLAALNYFQITERKKKIIMKLIAICGSARKQGNTAQMLHSVMQGAQSAGAETQLVNLFDLNFTDCVGCYACKLKNSTSYARCMLNDDLTPLLRRIEASDAIVLGSPVYYGNLSGQMRSFTDRLLFQYLDYGGKGQGPKPKNFKTALVATMNMNHKDCIDRGVADSLAWFSQVIGHTLGSCELLTLTNTVLFDNYTKYVYEMPDLEEKASRTEKIPPQDLQNAFHLGVRLVQS